MTGPKDVEGDHYYRICGDFNTSMDVSMNPPAIQKGAIVWVPFAFRETSMTTGGAFT